MSGDTDEHRRALNRERQRRYRLRHPKPGARGMVPPDWIAECSECGHARPGYWHPPDGFRGKCQHPRLRADGQLDYRYVPRHLRPP